MTLALTPLVSLLFGGPSLTDHDDLAVGAARIGCPVWRASQLLANLELRVGLPKPVRADALRVQQWSRRMGELESEKPGRFYARSYALDPIGTATTVLAWRDALAMAGWNGEAIANGGERLETLRDLATELAPGIAERLASVDAELRATKVRPFDALLLTEARSLWPGRWQRLFTLLEELGAKVETREASFDPIAGDSDLARLQRLVKGGERSPLRGDGSVMLLRAATSWELADATASLLRSWNEPSTVVIRAGETRPLDFALATHGLETQGLDETSPWRPALQILPLAIELAFEPRDPYRLLELLTLPVGPFQGIVGRELASALAEAPGIGGGAWREAKERIVEITRARADGEERIARYLDRIATWLEAPGLDASRPAPRAELLAVCARVRTWLQRRLAQATEDGDLDANGEILATAYAQASALHEALSHESRDALDLVDARLLVEQVSAGHALSLAIERAGRIDHVDAPAALRRARDVVVWWHCVAGTDWRPAARPWRRSELDALAAAGIHLQDPAERLAADAWSWHGAILAARKRLVLAVPRWAAGEAIDAHPIWHEIVARFGATPADIARVTVDARDLLRGHPFAKPEVKDYGPLALPEARSEWKLDPRFLGPAARHSATSLDALVGCPLRWVLHYRGGLNAGALESIASGALLNGKLGHRLVEDLHRAGAFAKPDSLGTAIETALDRLLKAEAAVLLRPGMAFELAQLREQLAAAIVRLSEMLIESQLTVLDVEVEIDTTWRSAALVGRIDVLLRDAAGNEVVLDLKWGRWRYRGLLEAGLATQLAVYAAARKAATSARAMPAAGYFALNKGEVLATSGPFANIARTLGPSLTETWEKLERTVDRVEKSLATGRVLVTGVKRSVPLVEALGVKEKERDRHLALPVESGCSYCAFGAICGKSWEAMP